LSRRVGKTRGRKSEVKLWKVQTKGKDTESSEESDKASLIDFIVSSDLNEECTIFTYEFKNDPEILVNAEGPLPVKFSAELVGSQLLGKRV